MTWFYSPILWKNLLWLVLGCDGQSGGWVVLKVDRGPWLWWPDIFRFISDNPRRPVPQHQTFPATKTYSWLCFVSFCLDESQGADLEASSQYCNRGIRQHASLLLSRQHHSSLRYTNKTLMVESNGFQNSPFNNMPSTNITSRSISSGTR